MRLNRYIREEDIVKTGLDTDEPEVNRKYSKESIKKRIDIIKSAINAAEEQKGDEDAKEAVIADLEDKLDKWKNVEGETKPAPPPPPEEEEPEEEPEKDADEE